MAFPEDTDPDEVDSLEAIPDENDPGNPGVANPGLDRHDFASEWATLWEEARDDPHEALPELAEFIGRLLRRHGYVIEQEDPVAQGDEREVLSTFWAALEVSEALEEGGTVDAGDLAQAINDLRDIYESLIERVEGGAH